MENLRPHPRLTELRICILTRCPGYLLEFEKHWYKEQACEIDAVIDTRERMYYLFSTCFYLPPGNQETVMHGGWKMREIGKCMTEVEMAVKGRIWECKRGLEILDWVSDISSALL